MPERLREQIKALEMACDILAIPSGEEEEDSADRQVAERIGRVASELRDLDQEWDNDAKCLRALTLGLLRRGSEPGNPGEASRNG